MYTYPKFRYIPAVCLTVQRFHHWTRTVRMNEYRKKKNRAKYTNTAFEYICYSLIYVCISLNHRIFTAIEQNNVAATASKFIFCFYFIWFCCCVIIEIFHTAKMLWLFSRQQTLYCAICAKWNGRQRLFF